MTFSLEYSRSKFIGSAHFTLTSLDSNALVLLSIVWLAFVFFLHSSFECNLRASLLVLEYERPVDTGRDVLELGRTMWAARGTGQELLMSLTRGEVFQKLAKEVGCIVQKATKKFSF